MSRVLIADDNSNIQKMASLALKEAGVEVVAVNNGEAAVRRLAEISPDLVLADIFMPVRNGYEVCEFVKRDPRHMHIPVILLTGAFDPFDEHEAQRVQADGVLKKPFVPPEPLVNMVTTLLSKAASERMVAVAVPASGPTEHAAEERSVSAKEAPAEFPHAVPDEPEEEIAPAPTRASFTADENTLAFSSLLEVPAAPAEEESVVTAMRDPALGDPAFWASPPAEETTPADEIAELAEELSQPSAWNDFVAEQAETLPPTIENPAANVVDNAVQNYVEQQSENPAHAEVPAIDDVAEATPAMTAPVADNEKPAKESTKVPQWPALDLAPAADETVVSPSDELTQSQPAEAQPVAEHPLSIWASAISSEPAPVEEHLDPTSSVSMAAEPMPGALEIHAAESLSAAEPELITEAEPETSESASSAYAAVNELEKTPNSAEQTAAIDATAALTPSYEAVAPSEAAFTDALESALHSLPIAIVPAAPEPSGSDASELVQETPQAEKPASPDPELLESVVSRVIERMQPKMIEIVTREILRPVVEALVRREREKR